MKNQILRKRYFRKYWSKFKFTTALIRKYYNQAVAFDHRRIWLQKENQKKGLRVESLKQDQNQGPNPNQNLEVRKNHLVDMPLAFRVEKKQWNKYLAKVTLPQVK